MNAFLFFFFDAIESPSSGLDFYFEGDVQVDAEETDSGCLWTCIDVIAEVTHKSNAKREKMLHAEQKRIIRSYSL